MNLEGFYRAFEERHRGSRELILSRLGVYLPFVRPLLDFYPEASVVDVGCGRGEWLELMRSIGFDAHGVDLNEGMLAACRERGLSVECSDAIAYLQSLGDESQCVVSGFHVAEHIGFEQLHSLVFHAKRVLKPGGVLILETPNPENIAVGACNFYLDPTHSRPIPPDLLSFVSEYHGFSRVKILRLQESSDLHQRQDVTLVDVLFGVSPDYAVIAQKNGEYELLSKMDASFEMDYGITLPELAARHHANINSQFSEMHNNLPSGVQCAVVGNNYSLEEKVGFSQLSNDFEKLVQENQQYASRCAELERLLLNTRVAAEQVQVQLDEVRARLQAVYDSLSWRLMAPLRWLAGICAVPRMKFCRLLEGWGLLRVAPSKVIPVAAEKSVSRNNEAGAQVSCRQVEIFKDLKESTRGIKEG